QPRGIVVRPADRQSAVAPRPIERASPGDAERARSARATDRATGSVFRHAPWGNLGAAMETRGRQSCSGRASRLSRASRSTEERTLETHRGPVLEDPSMDASMAPTTGRSGPGELGVSFGKDHDSIRARQPMAMADSATAENDWIGMGDVPDP